MLSDTLADVDVDAIAAGLLAAFETGRPIDPLTAARPDLSVVTAYRVQRALLAGHAHAGRRLSGRKIGLTSLAMQRQLGIDSPDFGALLDSHTWGDGAALSRTGLGMIAPKIEPEIAFVLDRELRGPGVDAAAVLAATRAVIPALEIIDSRVRDWKIGLADTIADNASCFGAVLGDPVALADAGPLPELTVRMHRDGALVQEGGGAAVMDDPARAVAWLANELARFGEALPAGQPILAGSFTAAVDAAPGRYTATFAPSAHHSAALSAHRSAAPSAHRSAAPAADRSAAPAADHSAPWSVAVTVEA